jgi:hypothetical protein
MPTAERLLSIAAEGGWIELYRDSHVPSSNSRYRAMVVDQTPTYLVEHERGASSRRDSGWLPTWAAAIEWLGRYPWPNLVCRYVHPSVAQLVWTAAQDYIDRAGYPLRAGVLERWRQHCQTIGPPEAADD